MDTSDRDVGEETGNGSTPVNILYQHTRDTFEYLDKHAEDGPDGRVYIGSMAKVIRNLDIGNGYQGTITQALYDMECLRMIRRGAGLTPSIYLLLGPSPDPTKFKSRRRERTTGSVKKGTQVVNQAVTDMSERLGAVEDKIELLWARVIGRDLETRIAVLEEIASISAERTALEPEETESHGE
jgi:hypothetical protein